MNLSEAIEIIEAELKTSEARNSTNNTWDYPYLHGLKFALEQVKKCDLADVGGSFCVICNQVCEPSPTTDGWSHLELGKCVHFECAQKIASSRPKE